jgi:hypothetical protein
VSIGIHSVSENTRAADYHNASAMQWNEIAGKGFRMTCLRQGRLHQGFAVWPLILANFGVPTYLGDTQLALAIFTRGTTNTKV